MATSFTGILKASWNLLLRTIKQIKKMITVDHLLKREEYLESLLPCPESDLLEEHFESFEKHCTYIRGGFYQWLGYKSVDTRELWLMGVLHKSGVKFEYN
jgi:hypothetical protein